MNGTDRRIARCSYRPRAGAASAPEPYVPPVVLKHACRFRFHGRGRERFACGFACEQRRRPRREQRTRRLCLRRAVSESAARADSSLATMAITPLTLSATSRSPAGRSQLSIGGFCRWSQQ